MDSFQTFEDHFSVGMEEKSDRPFIYSYADEDHPNHLCCPITLNLIKEPVILMGDGYTYEKTALQDWLKSKDTSPTTNEPLFSKQYVINHAIKNQIDAYNRKLTSISRKKYQKLFSSSRGRLHQQKNSITINLQLLGDSNVGKTTLRGFVEFNEHRVVNATMGPEYSFVKTKHSFRNKQIHARLGDIAGQFDRFHTLMKQCYRNIQGAVLVCSVDEPHSVKNLITNWHQSLCEYAPDDVYVVVIINKCDLLHSNSGNDIQKVRQYEKVQRAAIRFAAHNGYPVYNTSCITGQYIHTAFNDLIDRILRDEEIWKILNRDKKPKYHADLKYSYGNNKKILPQKSDGNCC